MPPGCESLDTSKDGSPAPSPPRCRLAGRATAAGVPPPRGAGEGVSPSRLQALGASTALEAQLANSRLWLNRIQK